MQFKCKKRKTTANYRHTESLFYYYFTRQGLTTHTLAQIKKTQMKRNKKRKDFPEFRGLPRVLAARVPSAHTDPQPKRQLRHDVERTGSFSHEPTTTTDEKTRPPTKDDDDDRPGRETTTTIDQGERRRRRSTRERERVSEAPSPRAFSLPDRFSARATRTGPHLRAHSRLNPLSKSASPKLRLRLLRARKQKHSLQLRLSDSLPGTFCPARPSAVFHKKLCVLLLPTSLFHQPLAEPQLP